MNEQEIEMMTKVFLKAYMTALDEIHNPDIASVAAFGVATIVANRPKKQERTQFNPLATAICMMMNQGQENKRKDGGKKKDGEAKNGEVSE